MKINELREILCGLGLAALLGLFTLVMHKKLSTDRASSFVGYSDSTWQVRDTLFVRYKGKVTGIDLTRLEESDGK